MDNLYYYEVFWGTEVNPSRESDKMMEKLWEKQRVVDSE